MTTKKLIIDQSIYQSINKEEEFYNNFEYLNQENTISVILSNDENNITPEQSVQPSPLLTPKVSYFELTSLPKKGNKFFIKEKIKKLLLCSCFFTSEQLPLDKLLEENV
jgi:hypothetical protein